MTSDDRYGLSDLPWERRSDEGTKAFAAFIVYRDLGPRRTLRQAALAHYQIAEDDLKASSKKRVVEGWSSRHQWRARAEEWDNYVRHETEEKELKAIADMRVRHASLMTVMQSKMVTYLNGLTDDVIKRMSPDVAMRALDLAIKNERIARGVPDTVTALTNVHGGPVQHQEQAVTDESLERKLRAWYASRNPENTLEKGEPDRDGLVPEDGGEDE